MWDIFIAHASSDEDKAKELFKAFKELDPDCNVFFDVFSLDSRVPWDKAIPEREGKTQSATVFVTPTTVW